jgi:hypothetical protein
MHIVQLKLSMWHYTHDHVNDVTDKYNNISFECIHTYYYYDHRLSYRTHCDTSGNICPHLSKCRYSICIFKILGGCNLMVEDGVKHSVHSFIQIMIIILKGNMHVWISWLSGTWRIFMICFILETILLLTRHVWTKYSILLRKPEHMS